MRRRFLVIAAAVLGLVSAGCATGARVGGDRVGAGVGGYVGPVPPSLQRGYSGP